MRTVNPLRSCFFCIVLFLPLSIAAGEDWPQWGGRDGRNMVSEATGLPASFEPGKKLPSGGGIDPATTTNVWWSARLASQTYGNPTVAGGKVFVGTDDADLTRDARFKRTRGGLVLCLEEATGKLLWRLVVPQRKKLPPGIHFGHQHLGVCSSPTVDGERVYVVSSAGDILCLDVNGLADGNDGPFTDEARYMVPDGAPPVTLAAGDADIVWRYDVIDEAGVFPHDAASNSPLVYGDLVYAGTSNGVDKPHKKVVAPEAPSLVVLDKRTGRLAATDGEKIGRRLYHAQWSSPSAGVVGGKALIFFGGGDGVCYAFEALTAVPEKPVLLKKVWSYDCNPPAYKFRNGKPIPYYDGDKRKRRGNKNDGRYVGPSQIIATPVFHRNRIYVALGQDPAHGRGKGMLHCIDATGTGDITTSGTIWTYDGLDRSISTVAVAGGLVYCPDIAGRLHCVDADTGAPCWVHETRAEIWGSPLVADGKVYLGTKKNFWVFAAGREAKVLDEIRLGSPVYATPIVAGGVLFVASQQYLWAVASDRRQLGARS
jgi:outer membrane protein assembly factor BamB